MIELSVDNLHLTYGDNPVLKGVSMELKRGEVVSLLGHRGAVKPPYCVRLLGWRNRVRATLSLVKRRFMTAHPIVKYPPKSAI